MTLSLCRHLGLDVGRRYVLNYPQLPAAHTVFGDTRVNITTEGRRYLGAPLGTLEFQQNFVIDLVQNWVSETENISKIAETEPHACYSAFCPSTVPSYGIPTILDNHYSLHHRDLFALPARDGGLGILSPMATAYDEYDHSRSATAPLVQLITEQNTTIDSAKIPSVASRSYNGML
eukprot:sb/3471924/